MKDLTECILSDEDSSQPTDWRRDEWMYLGDWAWAHSRADTCTVWSLHEYLIDWSNTVSSSINWSYIEWYTACCGEMHVSTEGRWMYHILTIIVIQWDSIVFYCYYHSTAHHHNTIYSYEWLPDIMVISINSYECIIYLDALPIISLFVCGWKFESYRVL